jgi:hypothetical protein
LQHIQQVLTEPHRENKIGIIKSEEKTLSPDKTKKEDFVNHVNITHQVMDEGINNTSFSNNPFSLTKKRRKDLGD